MAKWYHEIRDPVHNFIRVTAHERRVIDSAPVQRLRNIHQLALAYLLYPGASHRRFEHSLGVMHLAGELFDQLTDPVQVTDQVRDLVDEVGQLENLSYWRTVVRLAALCHDVGHLPFSHAAEHDLLPEGRTHESLTEAVVLNSEIAEILADITPPIPPDLVAKIAIGPEKWAGKPFSDWEALLSDIITGDAFGVDRIDYLLRDSLHAGVKYGVFDHHRLLSTLRLMPDAPVEEHDEGGALKVVIGIEEGGLHAAEALVIARYFMFAQVYMHPVRAAYDEHLVDFLRGWLGENGYPGTLEGHLELTDNDVLVAMKSAARDPHSPASRAARSICERRHFRVVYNETPADRGIHVRPGEAIHEAVAEEFGAENAKLVVRSIKSGATGFSVRRPDGTVASAESLGRSLVPAPTTHRYVLVDPDLAPQVAAWMSQARDTILLRE